MKLHVSLPSGRCESFVVNQSAAVSDLKAAVQQSFGRCFPQAGRAQRNSSGLNRPRGNLQT